MTRYIENRLSGVPESGWLNFTILMEGEKWGVKNPLVSRRSVANLTEQQHKNGIKYACVDCWWKLHMQKHGLASPFTLIVYNTLIYINDQLMTVRWNITVRSRQQMALHNVPPWHSTPHKNQNGLYSDDLTVKIFKKKFWPLVTQYL